MNTFIFLASVSFLGISAHLKHEMEHGKQDLSGLSLEELFTYGSHLDRRSPEEVEFDLETINSLKGLPTNDILAELMKYSSSMFQRSISDSASVYRQKVGNIVPCVLAQRENQIIFVNNL